MAGNNIRLELKGVIINNPHLFKKKATIDDGPEKYRANFSMDPDTKPGKRNIKLIEDAIEEIKENLEMKKIKEGRVCLVDGNDITNDDGDVYAGYEDMMILRATNNKRPKVVDRQKDDHLTEDDDKPQGGDIVNAIVDVYGTTDKKFGGNGIFATLMGVQFVKEGERFGGGGSLGDDAFGDVEDDEDEDEPKSKKKSSKSKKARDDDDDEDEPKSKKKSKKSSRDDDDDEDEPKSKKKSKKSRRDLDDEDEDEDV